MYTLKRALSVLLCLVLFASFALPAHAADTLIEEAFATYSVPAAGEAFDFSAITVPLGAHYTAKIVDAYYRDPGTGKYEHIKSGDIVTEGTRYSVRIRFYPDSYYRFDDSTTVYTVNGEVQKTIVGTNMIETIMYPAGKAPDKPTPAKPTFRDRVTTFFRDMRNRFLYLIFWVRSLFGKKM